MDSKITTANDMRERLIAKAAEDEAFRARLIADPKAAIQEGLDVAVPDGFTVEVHQESADTGHLVLPPLAGLGEGDLQQAAGGHHVGTWRKRHWWGSRSDSVFVPDEH